MFILEKPFISDHLLAYAERTKTPVLRTPFTEAASSRFALSLLNDEDFAAKLRTGKRLYTSSENALDWVYTHCAGSDMVRCCDVMKDKAAMRVLLQDMYPDFFFQKIPADELASVDAASLKFPCVLKPSVGFFSLGVHTVENVSAWQATVADMTAEMAASAAIFPESVLNKGVFLVEEYITGEEFAVDMYYDDAGEPVILNIFQHRFASASDVSDRLYFTSKEVIERWMQIFLDFFRNANKTLRIKNFPSHVEMRVDGSKILPIEFNPLRCAGMNCTDLAFYAYGFDTYDYYLHNLRPDFNAILKNQDDSTYSMIILDKRSGMPENASFNFEALQTKLQHVLEIRDLQSLNLPLFGIIFARTDADHAYQLDALLTSDLHEFLC